MAIKLNLLPEEHEVNKNLSSVLKTIKALGVIGIAAFLISGVGLGVFFVASTLSLNTAKTNVSNLTAQITAQQKSEQQIVLVKDRIEKVASIQAIPSAMVNLLAIDPYLNNISSTSTVNQLDVSPETITVSVNLKSYTDVNTFLEALQTSEVFKTISLESFNLNPTTGYSVEIKTSKDNK